MGFTASQVAEHWKSVGGRKWETAVGEGEHVLPITILSVFMPGPADAAMRNLASRRSDERRRDRETTALLPLKQRSRYHFIHSSCVSLLRDRD